ncbi:MAG: hypothetical protein J6V09_07415, partial [Clostridia bacterium]|nr:hypothetical protein [Clostridia bacterium]
NAKALAELLNTGIRLYSATPAAVASGGLFEHYPEILSNHMKKYCDVRLTVSPLPPIYGACKRACPAISADFYENFKKSYGEIKK